MHAVLAGISSGVPAVHVPALAVFMSYRPRTPADADHLRRTPADGDDLRRRPADADHADEMNDRGSLLLRNQSRNCDSQWDEWRTRSKEKETNRTERKEENKRRAMSR